MLRTCCLSHVNRNWLCECIYSMYGSVTDCICIVLLSIDVCFMHVFLIAVLICAYLQPVNGLASEPDKVWPNVPIPQTVPLPVPICNGCGNSSDGMLLMPSTSLGNIGQKYG